MSLKITTSRRRAFLHHLTNSGNQTLSAEKAKVSRSWVCLQRQADPAFDAECREAIEVAKMMLEDEAALDATAGRSTSACGLRSGRAGSGRRPANPDWRYFEGHELVVSGTNGRRTQVRRSKLSQWSPTAEDRFLSVLAGTCNVKAACAAAGRAVSSAYAHRKRWPGFAARWDQAVEIGQRELETRMIQNVRYHFDRELPPPDAPMQDISVMDAIRMLRMYERRDREKRKRRWD